MEKRFIIETVSSVALLFGNAGAVALRGALVAEERIPLSVETANKVFKREDEELNVQPSRVIGQLYEPLRTDVTHVASRRTFPIRRAYGRAGQLGNRSRGDIRNFKYR